MEYKKYIETVRSPNTVKIGGEILYKGRDASNWLEKQKDRNIKCCAKLSYT